MTETPPVGLDDPDLVAAAPIGVEYDPLFVGGPDRAAVLECIIGELAAIVVRDPNTHLEAYKIKRAKGEEKHVKRLGLVVENQFGSTLIDTVRADRLLVPTQKDLVNPIAAPQGASEVDHFLCYKVKKPKGFQKILGVTVLDQFEDRVYDLRKPKRLCNAVDKNGEGIQNPDAHLLCYQGKRAKGQPKHVKRSGVNLHTQFGPEKLDTKTEEELCVPSTLL